MDTLIIDHRTQILLYLKYSSDLRYIIPIIPGDTLSLEIEKNNITGYLKNSDRGLKDIFSFYNTYLNFEKYSGWYELFFDKLAKDFFNHNKNKFRDLCLDEFSSYKYAQNALDSLKNKSEAINTNYDLLKNHLKYRYLNLTQINHTREIFKSDLKFFPETDNIYIDTLAYFEPYMIFLKNYIVENTLENTRVLIGKNTLAYDFPSLYDTINSNTNIPMQIKEQLNHWIIDQILDEFPREQKEKYFDLYKVKGDSVHISMLMKNHLIDINLPYRDDKNSLMNIRQEITSMSDIVKDNGKYKYIDIWASWCMPCRKSLPYSLLARENYSDHVDFIYISIDEKFSSWNSAVEKEKLVNITKNYLLLDPKNSDFIDMLEIKEIPRYILLDKSGNIIDKNALGPSAFNFKALQ